MASVLFSTFIIMLSSDEQIRSYYIDSPGHKSVVQICGDIDWRADQCVNVPMGMTLGQAVEQVIKLNESMKNERTN